MLALRAGINSADISVMPLTIGIARVNNRAIRYYYNHNAKLYYAQYN